MSDLRAYWMARGVIPRWQYLLVYVLIVGAGAFGFAQTHAAQQRAEHLARQVAAQRLAAIRSTCEEQNVRHDQTLRTLDRLIAKVPPDRRAQARRSRASTVLLIDALAPKRDCDQRVRQFSRVP